MVARYHNGFALTVENAQLVPNMSVLRRLKNTYRIFQPSSVTPPPSSMTPPSASEAPPPSPETPPDPQVSALQSELQALRQDGEHHKRVITELGILMGKFRDERDSYKLQSEAASYELRRLSRPMAQAPADGTSAPETNRPAKAGTSALRILCVGTGRDGTTSLARIMQDVFDQQETGEKAQHEWASSELNTLFCNWMETKDPAFEAQIREMIRHCPSACVTGNGYAAVLPIIAEELGDQVTLVHLRRRDRDACIASLVENAELSPQNHYYYADSPIATSKRPTAFHFGEMSQEQWSALSLHAKFGWYYDKTHALIEQHKRLFTKTLSVDTEDLSDENVRAALARAAGSDQTPRAFHVNRFVDLRHVPQARHSYVQRLLGQLNVQKLADDDLYGVGAVLNEFIYHLAHFPDAEPGAIDELRWTLREAHRLLSARLADVQDLMERVGMPAESSPPNPERPTDHG